MDFSGSSWPFDGPLDADGNAPALPESGWEDLFEPLHEPGSIAVPGDLDGQVYADGSGMLVKSRPAPLGGMVKGHRWRNPLPDSWPVDNGDAQPRIDRVFLRLDPAGNRLGLVYVKGVPDTNPTPPEPLREAGGRWDVRWASIRVEANAGTDGNAVQAITALKVTDERRFRGMRIWQYPDKASLPPAGSGVPWGQLALAANEGSIYRWNSTSWELYVFRDVNQARTVRTYSYANEASFPPISDGVPFGQLAYSMATGNTYRNNGVAWEIYLFRGRFVNDQDPTDWVMGVSTAFSWPTTATYGLWWRRGGLVEGRATASLNVNPPYPNALTVTLPVVTVAPGTIVGDCTVTNYAGQVKHHGYLVQIATGEALLQSFTGPPWVTPANGDTVTVRLSYRG